MTQDEKAILYDNLLREGDRINRRISTIKSNINLTPEEESELAKLNQQVKVLENRLNSLFNQG